MADHGPHPDRFVCVHGHFYQPPRENPWLEAVELQDSAYPYHDWNQRVTAECYAPNARSRILDGHDRIVRIVNNYERISFNFGPTLLSWLEGHDPETYAAILAADRASRHRFSGHGSALAQAYNHAILPLCNRRDKRTQVLWGLRDFEHRFGRQAEGMWLPETAVDLETLEILADCGVRFTVLAPGQAAATRDRRGPGEWRDVNGERIDPRLPYLLRLPNAGSIALFFYDGIVSRAVAFERLLARGGLFAQRLLDAFDAHRDGPQLVHVATDGETYGHHHAFGDMALAYALHHIESNRLARLTNYGEYLALHPPTHEVRIHENSSWSCVHGVGRWREDCGCHSGSHPEWNQGWRRPLRDALDSLRDAVGPLFETTAGRYVRDPWAARDDFIELALDRSADARGRFLRRHERRELSDHETSLLLRLLEMQRHAMLMYTSCGWFFDDISGLETQQILQYAGRVLQLAEEMSVGRLMEPFLERLAHARSNLQEQGDGRRVFERRIAPLRVDLHRVGANFGAALLFGEPEEARTFPAYAVQCTDHQRLEFDGTRLAMGRLHVRSRITLAAEELVFAFVHGGDHEMYGGVRTFQGESAYRVMLVEMTGAFSRQALDQLPELFERHLLGARYSLQTLFRDEQHQILDRIVESTLADVEAVYGRLYSHHAPLMRVFAGLDTAPPRALRIAAELVLNNRIRRELESPEFDPRKLQELLADVRAGGVPLDQAAVAFAARATMARLLLQLTRQPDDLPLLERIQAAAVLIRALPFKVDLNEAENRYYKLLDRVYPEYRARAGDGDDHARGWVQRFTTLGDTLQVAVE